jgi:polyisoprenoid-binding protein YceI
MKKNNHYLMMGLILLSGFANAQIFIGQKGETKILGEAPKETITAESTALVGKLDLTNKKFNFKQPMNTFSFSQGDLQKKHAEENFFEVEKYPNALFSGEIINDTDISKDGTYDVTVRGTFTLHGVERDLKIPAVLTLQNNVMVVKSKFYVFLSDHNIKIPAFVSLKVSPEFTVDVELKMTKS